MEIRNNKKLQEYFISLGPEKQRDVVRFMNNVLIALKISDDEDFRTEAFNSLFEKYPELQDLMEGLL